MRLISKGKDAKVHNYTLIGGWLVSYGSLSRVHKENLRLFAFFAVTGTHPSRSSVCERFIGGSYAAIAAAFCAARAASRAAMVNRAITQRLWVNTVQVTESARCS